MIYRTLGTLVRPNWKQILGGVVFVVGVGIAIGLCDSSDNESETEILEISDSDGAELGTEE